MHMNRVEQSEIAFNGGSYCWHCEVSGKISRWLNISPKNNVTASEHVSIPYFPNIMF